MGCTSAESIDGDFTPGAEMTARIKPTKAGFSVAEMQKKNAGAPVAFVVDRIEPMNVFAYRRHAFAIDSTLDYSSEPMTLVTFTLEPIRGSDELIGNQAVVRQ